jgi:hypothetical protein
MPTTGDGTPPASAAPPAPAIASVPAATPAIPDYPTAWVNQMPRGISFPDDKAPQSQLKGDTNWALWVAKMKAA